tara:strand:+ start:7923 stop:8051 length:129 start_codon:yes stop_codon:yes gene_type:complete
MLDFFLGQWFNPTITILEKKLKKGIKRFIAAIFTGTIFGSFP